LTYHPLKIAALLSLAGLLAAQMSLPAWLQNDHSYLLAGLLTLPLLLPLRGMLHDRVYTYKWVGFLCMAYFMIGVSESFTGAQLRAYSVLSMGFALGLFFSSIYYTRYLRQRR
jgi:uncharacterized membrane protein